MKNSKFWSPILVFLAAMLWATDAPLRLHVTEELPSFLIVFIEHAFSLIVLLPILIGAIPELKTLSFKAWVSLFVIGVGSSALALIFFTEAFHYMNPSAAIILQKLQPFIAVTLAYFFLKEKFTKSFWSLSFVAIFGAYLISFPNLVPKVFDGEVWNPEFIGILLAIGAALLWAAGTIFGRITLKELEWKHVTALRFFIGFIFLGIWNTVNGDILRITDISGESFIYLFTMSMVSGAVGLLIYYRGLRDTSASIATISELGFVVAAVLVNFLFIDAILLPAQIIGMLIVLLAVVGLAKKQEE